MWSLLTITCLVAAQAPGVKLASPGLRGLNLPVEEVAFYSDHLAQQLTLAGVPVVTQEEIATLLGLERQRELAGCSDAQTSCLAEIANALGTDGIVSGSVGRLSGKVQINLKVLRMRDARLVAVFSSQVDSSAQVLSELTRAAHEMAPAIAEAFGLTLRTAGFQPWPAVVPAAVGVVGLALGAGFLVAAGASDHQLRTAGVDGAPDLSLQQARDLVTTEKNQSLIGTVALALGGTALVAGAVVGWATQRSPSGVALVPMPGGLALAGSFP